MALDDHEPMSVQKYGVDLVRGTSTSARGTMLSGTTGPSPEGEMAGLLADLDLVRDAHHCPHGRPTAVAFGRRDLERLFKRV